MLEGFVDKTAPGGDVLRVAALQFYHAQSRPVGEGRVGVEFFFRRPIEILQIFQFGLRRVGRTLQFQQIGDQHAELGAPVAHMILPNYFVSQALQHPRQAIANHRAAQVADMHLLGQIRR